MRDEMVELGSQKLGRGLWIAFCVVILIAAGLFVYVYIDGHKQTQKENKAAKEGGYIFTSELEPRNERILVIQCDEERYQKPFNDFVLSGLGLENADVVGITGGPRWFAVPKDIELPDWLKPLKRMSVELLKRHSPGRIVLIAHSHCIINDVVAAWKDKQLTNEEEIQQARDASRVLKEWFPDADIEIYYAEEISKNMLGFTAVFTAVEEKTATEDYEDKQAEQVKKEE